jgi:hypothetical protein
MNYTAKNTPETGNSAALELKEPSLAYYTGNVGNAIAEPFEADRDDDDWDADLGAPESITVHSYEELYQKLEEARIAREAGLVYPFKDAMREFWRKVDNAKL